MPADAAADTTLVLMDIDATMIVTDRAGLRAMRHAGKSLFGESFAIEGVDFAGRLDTLIIPEMLAMNGVPATGDNIGAFAHAYESRLVHLLDAESPGKRALPGVIDLLTRLRTDDRFTLGVLTGNFERTGGMKLRACGIDPDWFRVRVWCSDAVGTPPSRDELPVVAMQRHRQVTGAPIHPRRVVVVGDSPHDVRCARVNGCRSLGVATGIHGVEDLQAAGADLAVASLNDVDGVVTFLTA